MESNKCYGGDDVVDITFPKEMLPDAVEQQLYADDASVMIVTFDEDTASTKTMNAIEQIKDVSDKDCYLGGMERYCTGYKRIGKCRNAALYPYCSDLKLGCFISWIGIDDRPH